MKEYKPLANPEIVFREESDKWAILFNPDTGEAFALDQVSVFIWKRLSGQIYVKDIIKEMYDIFDDIPDDVEQHCEEFISHLIKNNLATTQ
jgi:SynChlorMet cassette protein ScmD